jgi:carboxypeptidase C (cathepsin A)
MQKVALLPVILCLLVCCWQPAAAQQPENQSKQDLNNPEESVTHHTLTINGEVLKYTASAGFLQIKNTAGQPQARLFYVAYLLETGQAPSPRPLTFAFNGGPGASSVWLHLGAMGPRRVMLADAGTRLPENDRLTDNEYSWLPFTDLVFIDPVGTGYSRPADGVNSDQFYSVKGDVASIGSAIRLFVNAHDRWLSPKYLAGESYGTTRSALLAHYLQQQEGMLLAGVVLLSAALNFEAISFDSGNDLPYPLYLPTYTAVAWYHKRLAPELQANLESTLAEVRKWSLQEYMPALARGDSLSAAETKQIAGKLAAYSGLSPSFIELNQLRVTVEQFTKELLRADYHTIGLLDGRVTGYTINPAAPFMSFDPSLFLVTGPFVAALEHYLQTELAFSTDLKYIYLSEEISRSWQWGTQGQGYLYVGKELQAAVSLNYLMKVFTASGYFDLTTPFLTQNYSFEHIYLAPELQDNFIHHYYPAGHQIYNDVPSLKMLTADAAVFYKNTP